MNILLYIQSQQRLFQEKISSTLHSMQTTDSLAPMMVLVTIGFVYGLLHAVGPGHGKVVLSSYMVASHARIKRALTITFLSSMLQSLVAIGLVMSIFFLLGLTRASAENAAAILEILSFCIIIALGGKLVWSGVSRLRPHHHHHACCNHHHAPNADSIAHAKNLREQIIMIASVGMRPCSGAIILLYFSCILGLAWAGILATLAMGLGTAIATSCFVLLAIGSKTWALKLSRLSESSAAKAQAVISIIGGLIIIAAGSVFLLAMVPQENVITSQNHPLMRSLQTEHKD